MHDTYKLTRDLKQSEYETGGNLFRRFQDEGFTAEKAVALVYRAGIVDGRITERERAARNAYHKAIHVRQPEAEPHDEKEESEVTCNE